MLGVVARFGSTGGMVTVPNLIGKTQSQASSTLTSVGLTVGSVTTTTTSSSSNDGLVDSQTTASGTLVNFGTAISYRYQVYSAPAVITYGSYEVTSVYEQELGCDTASLQTKFAVVTSYRRQILSDGSWTGSYYYPPSTTEIVLRSIDGKCGYYVTRCTSSSSTSLGTCSSGFQSRTVYTTTTCTQNGVVTYTSPSYPTSDTVACCSSSSVSSGTYGSCFCARKCKDLTTTTNCGGTITTTTTAGAGACASCTGGPC